MSTGQLNEPAFEAPAVAPEAATPNFVGVLRAMLAVSDKVSDLIFSPGRPPQVELSGKLQPVAVAGLERLTRRPHGAMAKLSRRAEGGREEPRTYGAATMSFSVPGFSRFRVNVCRQRGTHAIVMRVVPAAPAQLQRLRIPTSSANLRLKTASSSSPARRGRGNRRRSPPSSISSTRRRPTTSSPSKTPSSFCTGTRPRPSTSASCTRTRPTSRGPCARRCGRPRR